MYVQYDCNLPSIFRDLGRKRSVPVCQNINLGHSTEPKVGQSLYTPKGRTNIRTHRVIVCKI